MGAAAARAPKIGAIKVADPVDKKWRRTKPMKLTGAAPTVSEDRTSTQAAPAAYRRRSAHGGASGWLAGNDFKLESRLPDRREI
jgi:hypothetical protein